MVRVTSATDRPSRSIAATTTLSPAGHSRAARPIPAGPSWLTRRVCRWTPDSDRLRQHQVRQVERPGPGRCADPRVAEHRRHTHTVSPVADTRGFETRAARQEIETERPAGTRPAASAVEASCLSRFENLDSCGQRPRGFRPVVADQQSENVELVVIAQRLVQEAVRRAHATTATPDRRTSRWRRPHHLRHRRQDRLAGLGFGDQATRQLGQVIAVGSRVAAQQREGIVHRHR